MLHFDEKRMAENIKNHELWFEGKLLRPLTQVVIPDAYPLERHTSTPRLDMTNCTDFSITPEQIIQTEDDYFCACEFLGDAIPIMHFNTFGPGVLAAFCGARLDNSSGKVWFFPEVKKHISEIHVKYDPENKWVKRIKDIYRAGIGKWQGKVIMEMPDLGGVMDVAAAFCETENLLFYLYDEPDEVKRLVSEIEAAWYEAYNDLASVLAPQKAYSSWIGLVSSKPSYVPQCDFSYMISNDMFREFVLETLKKDAQKLDYTIYHLDGKGELNHLDDILKIEKLNAVQWVPGAGNEEGIYWKDVYEKIANAGKNYMVCASPEKYLELLSVLHGTPYVNFGFSKNDRELAEKIISAR